MKRKMNKLSEREEKLELLTNASDFFFEKVDAWFKEQKITAIFFLKNLSDSRKQYDSFKNAKCKATLPSCVVMSYFEPLFSKDDFYKLLEIKAKCGRLTRSDAIWLHGRNLHFKRFNSAELQKTFDVAEKPKETYEERRRRRNVMAMYYLEKANSL